MNKAEVNELKGRFAPNKNNITTVRGCYVSDAKTIISTFESAPVLLPEEEWTKYLALFKRTFSGTLGQNLTEVEFSTQQVMEGQEHKRLATLRDTALKDENAVMEFYQLVIDYLELDTNYLILLLQDDYQVPFRGKDELKVEQAANSAQFNYIVCAICPVKQTKPALSYDMSSRLFHNMPIEWVVSAPELGFVFPAFEDRVANIYKALYYTRDAAEMHEDFYGAVFNTEIALPPVEQKEVFQAVLEDTLAEACNYEVVQTIHEQVSDLIDQQKKDKQAEPPVISKQEVKTMLESCGVPEPSIASFERRYDEQLGANTVLGAQNIVNTKKFEMRTADVVIQVSPDRSDLIETRIINGLKYILIRADESVQVNGMKISIGE